jgi:hypothetical protein
MIEHLLNTLRFDSSFEIEINASSVEIIDDQSYCDHKAENVSVECDQYTAIIASSLILPKWWSPIWSSTGCFQQRCIVLRTIDCPVRIISFTIFEHANDSPLGNRMCIGTWNWQWFDFCEWKVHMKQVLFEVDQDMMIECNEIFWKVLLNVSLT